VCPAQFRIVVQGEVDPSPLLLALLDRPGHGSYSSQVRSIYILPSVPVVKSRPPSGDCWIHEIKFDGWRAQLHKRGERVVIFSRNGCDFTQRFREIRDSIACLATHTAILAAEIIARDHQGLPDFRALMSGAKHGLCAWCFDLMALEGRDLRSRPLLERRIQLRHLLAKTDDERLLYSEEFDDPNQLLAAASRASLEGIVSKLADQPYRSGKPRLDQGQNSDLARGEPGPVADV
jgi:bifunctional non-homologous end joining protein LigD